MLQSARSEKLPAFLIIEIVAVQDPDLYAKYRDSVSPNLDAGGGTYLVRGRPTEILEGDWRPNRIVVVRFDSADKAREWWNSSEYAELKAMRQGSTRTNMILVEGV
jgi:uncharacterized protein (DUF1330 family)